MIDSNVALNFLRTQWIGNLIHDLSSPLLAARGYARMAAEENRESLTERQRRYMIALLENLERMASVTYELNEFLRDDSLHLEAVDLHRLIDTELTELRDGAPETMSFENIFKSNCLSTIGDGEKLRSALRSFLRAAVQFTGSHGTVEVVAQEESQKILVEICGTRNPTAPPSRQPDLTGPCKLWRLNGGRVYVTQLSESQFFIGCELPVLRITGC